MSKINLDKNKKLDKNKRLEDIYIYIYKLFPDCVTETKENGKTTYAIDFDKLRDFLSGKIVGDKIQRYELTWPDKNKTRVLINKSTTNTLRPIKEKSIDFDKTKNLYIEGDNLEVLKVLRDTYFGKIDVIYIDPPYNTGNDFIYKDKFTKDNTEADIESGNIDEEGNTLVANKAENGRYHTNWLNMIYPRLFLAKDLLSETGVIFISIDDHEYANLKKVCDEIFGEENFIANLIWKSRRGGGNDASFVAIDHEYVLLYAKSIKNCNLSGIEKNDDEFEFEDEFVSTRGKYYLQQFDWSSLTYTKSLDYPITCPDNTKLYPGHVTEEEYLKRINNNASRNDFCWLMSKQTYQKAYENGFIVFEKNKKGQWNVRVKTYQKIDYKLKPIKRQFKLRSVILEDDEKNQLTTKNGGNQFEKVMGSKAIFDKPKDINLIKFFLKHLNKNSLILDFFSGSGTTAHSIMQLNKEDGGERKWIMIQIPEKTGNDSTAFSNNFHTICDIGIERIKKVGEIIKKENPNVDIGFRYLKIDSSNINDCSINANELVQTQLENFTNSIKPNRSNLDLVFEVMLSKKIPLDTKIETTKILDKTIYKVNGDFLICCFDNNLSKEFIKEVAKLSPIYLVFKESSFESDEAIKNIEQLIKSFSKTETKFEII